MLQRIDEKEALLIHASVLALTMPPQTNSELDNVVQRSLHRSIVVLAT